jgi:stage II sporulation protein D
MRRLGPLTVLTLLLLCATPQRASAQLGSYGAPVRFTPKTGTTLTLEGRGPFRGAIEVRREGGGLAIVNELELDHYVMGVREVPGSWPMEALKAQAVAARTYALWEIDRGYWKRFGFDVCATVSCQVYQGATAELGERGRRWSQAVRETAGQVLLDAQGKPALTRYHSTSGGRTVNNEIAFGNEGPRDYLKAVDDPFDKVSPLHRWKQTFKREHLEAILKSAIRLNGTIDEILVDESTLTTTIKTLGGELTKRNHELRSAISETAPKFYPALYPGTRSDGEPMPFTMPSSRFTVEKTPEGFIFHGRGYGHGVGMSQYGAMGRATEGHTYKQILAAYYGGLQPQTRTGARTLRVAIVRGVGSALVSGNGVFGVATNGQSLAASTLGGWAAATGGARSVTVSPPQGYDLPLAITGLNAPKELVVDPPMGETLDVSFVVPKPAQVTGIVTVEGREIARGKLVAEAGERKLRIKLDPDELAGRAASIVKLEAYDGTDTIESSVGVVLIKPGSPLWLKALWTLGIVLLVVIVLRARARARRRPV